MSDHITVSELKALLNDLPEDRPVNLQLTIQAPEHIEAQLSGLQANLQYESAKADASEREADYLLNLLWQIGIEDPHHLNQQRIAEMRAALEAVVRI